MGGEELRPRHCLEQAVGEARTAALEGDRALEHAAALARLEQVEHLLVAGRRHVEVDDRGLELEVVLVAVRVLHPHEDRPTDGVALDGVAIRVDEGRPRTQGADTVGRGAVGIEVGDGDRVALEDHPQELAHLDDAVVGRHRIDRRADRTGKDPRVGPGLGQRRGLEVAAQLGRQVDPRRVHLAGIEVREGIEDPQVGRVTLEHDLHWLTRAIDELHRAPRHRGPQAVDRAVAKVRVLQLGKEGDVEGQLTVVRATKVPRRGDRAFVDPGVEAGLGHRHRLRVDRDQGRIEPFEHHRKAVDRARIVAARLHHPHPHHVFGGEQIGFLTQSVEEGQARADGGRYGGDRVSGRRPRVADGDGVGQVLRRAAAAGGQLAVFAGTAHQGEIEVGGEDCGLFPGLRQGDGLGVATVEAGHHRGHRLDGGGGAAGEVIDHPETRHTSFEKLEGRLALLIDEVDALLAHRGARLGARVAEGIAVGGLDLFVVIELENSVAREVEGAVFGGDRAFEDSAALGGLEQRQRLGIEGRQRHQIDGGGVELLVIAVSVGILDPNPGRLTSDHVVGRIAVFVDELGARAERLDGVARAPGAVEVGGGEGVEGGGLNRILATFQQTVVR